MNSVEILWVLKDWNCWKSPWDEGVIRPETLSFGTVSFTPLRKRLLREGGRWKSKPLSKGEPEGGVRRRQQKSVPLYHAKAEFRRWIGDDFMLDAEVLDDAGGAIGPYPFDDGGKIPLEGVGQFGWIGHGDSSTNVAP